MAISSEPSLLGTLLKELFQRRKWQQRLDQHQLFPAWEDIVGAELAVHARPHCIRGKVLWLEVTDSVWMQQLHLQKMTLLALVNERLEGEELQDIRFRLETSLARPCRNELVAGSEPREEEVSPGEMNRFEELVRPVEDEELKATMRRLWLKSRRYGKGE
jgi:predicted nucleic acid-binding Zn ribbon protein